MNLENSTYKETSKIDIKIGINAGTKSKRATKKSPKALLISSSVSALSFSALILAMSSYVWAQSIPDECTPTKPSAGQSIDCIVDSMLSGAVDRVGLYIISPPDSKDPKVRATEIGTAAANITAYNDINRARVDGPAYSFGTPIDRSVTITGLGSGQMDEVYARNFEFRDTSVSVNDATGAEDVGLRAFNASRAEALTVVATGAGMFPPRWTG